MPLWIQRSSQVLTEFTVNFAKKLYFYLILYVHRRLLHTNTTMKRKLNKYGILINITLMILCFKWLKNININFLFSFNTIGCGPTHFGINCVQLCGCKNGAICDGATGDCQCQPGWFGTLCDQSKSLLN